MGGSTLKDIDLNAQDTDPVFALVYGASGTGKTHLMGTLGELGEVLIIDIDQGIKTLRNAPDLLKASTRISKLHRTIRSTVSTSHIACIINLF